MDTTRKSGVLKWSLIIGIVIVLNLFFNYALSVVYNSPRYEDFCENSQVIKEINTKDECIAIGGQWDENFYKGQIDTRNIPEGYCNQNYSCNKSFEDSLRKYERNVFITLVILGVLSIGISFILVNIAVSQGLSLGGVLSFVVASMRYWGNAPDVVKLLILLIALMALIYIAYKKFGNVSE